MDLGNISISCGTITLPESTEACAAATVETSFQFVFNGVVSNSNPGNPC